MAALSAGDYCWKCDRLIEKCGPGLKQWRHVGNQRTYCTVTVAVKPRQRKETY